MRTALSIMVLLCVCSPSFGSRECCEGDHWLKMSKEARGQFVYGYIKGLSEGRMAGCRNAIRGTASNVTPDACYDKGPSYNRDVYEYANRITQFFNDHPEDRIMFPVEVLGFMSDQLNYTNNQIHEKCKGKLNCQPNSI